MWPQTLEMSRDECRGMLRRLELESYSHIISVFRAQGALNEPKAKLLEELRQLFHITQERHRAEVRRAANDEQLCTIAENVGGPNTWQEWSREGRRPYPLLPRISPQTALTIVANDLAAKVCAENAKLAAPAETGIHFGEALMEQASYVSLKHGRSIRSQDQPTVIMEEPFKVPDVPNEVKKMTQKRKESESGGDGKPTKRRHMQQQQQQQSPLTPQQQTQQPPQLSVGNSAADEGDPAPLEQRPSPRTVQQRFFYQQQMKHKQRLASKRNLANSLGSSPHTGNAHGGRHISSAGGEAVAGGKRIAAPAKSGRRAQKQLQQQQKLHQQQQHHHHQQQQQPKVLLQSPEAVPNHMVVQPHVEYVLDEALKTLAASSSPTPTPTPTPSSTATPPYTLVNEQRPLVTLKPLKPLKPLVYGPQSGSGAGEIGSPTTPSSRGFASSPIVFKDKLQASPVLLQAQSQSTPVNKYIVEERQPDLSPSAPSTSRPISTATLPLTPQIISVQQIPAPPMGAKLRPAVASPTSSNSSILPPGTKITPKKINLREGDAKSKTLPSPAVRLLPYTEPIGSPLSPLKDSRVTPLSSASTVNIIKNIPASSLNNTLITPLPAGATSMPGNLFRAKVTTPQLKPVSGANSTSTVSSGVSTGATSTTVPSVTPQILGNIKLTTSTGGSATIKQVPSSALRNFKICSPNGKLFLPGKLPAGSIIHKLNNAGSAPGAVAATAVPTSSTTTSAMSPNPAREQRISIQKMQILPAGGSGNATASGAGAGAVVSSTATTISGLSQSVKQPSLSGKPTTLTFATAGGGKNNLVFLPASAASGMRAVTLATGKPKPNVVVIGATTSTSTAGSATSPNQSGASAGASKPKANQLITEDTPIDIINMPIIVADNGTSSEGVKQGSSKNAPLVVFNATDWEMELDQAATKTANTPSKQKLEDVIVEEDEEEELEDRIDADHPIDHTSSSDHNNSIIELNPEDESTIEYVDMDLEQPIEIESTSNISPETTTSLKAAIVSASATPQKKQPMEQPIGAGAAAL
ncbi:hypothetical protein KR067_003047 [Drosophila pandora]|nr:hypothetical protein KR067_003047 [Drosophila pandora]